MTHIDDELLSASLDGEAEPGAAEHLAACAECRARRDALAAARQALVAATPPSPTPDLVDQLVATALERGTGRRRSPAWLAAAALLLVVGLAGGVLATRDGDRDHEQLARQSATDSAAGEAGSTPRQLGDLGAQDDLDALVARMTASSPASSPLVAGPLSTAPTPPAPTCPAAVGEGPLVAEATATIRGTPALVRLYTGREGHRLVVAFSLPSCERLVERRL